MENNISSSNSSNGTTAGNRAQRRFRKLKGDEVKDFPGVNLANVKAVTVEDIFYMYFVLGLLSLIGNPDDIARCLRFAHELDVQVKAKGIGWVSSISIANGECQIVVTLSVTVKPEKSSTPAANAFAQLKDFLDNSALLKAGPTGKPATWKAKVNGTTLIDGQFQ